MFSSTLRRRAAKRSTPDRPLRWRGDAKLEAIGARAQVFQPDRRRQRAPNELDALIGSRLPRIPSAASNSSTRMQISATSDRLRRANEISFSTCLSKNGWFEQLGVRDRPCATTRAMPGFPPASRAWSKAAPALPCARAVRQRRRRFLNEVGRAERGRASRSPLSSSPEMITIGSSRIRCTLELRTHPIQQLETVDLRHRQVADDDADRESSRIACHAASPSTDLARFKAIAQMLLRSTPHAQCASRRRSKRAAWRPLGTACRRERLPRSTANAASVRERAPDRLDWEIYRNRA